MSETHRNFFNKRVCYLLIAGALLLLLSVVVVSFRLKAIPEPEEVKEKTDPEPHRVRLASPKVFDAEAFKRTIIDNNLFRPLGWTPPRSIEPYRLIGTILPRAANTPLQAIIQTAAGNTTHIVTTGEKIDADTEVVSIESKQVVLESKGQPRTLYLPSGF